MFTKRLIDANKFDRFIISVPEDVYDAFSYIRGVEDVLNIIRETKTENEEEMDETD